MTHINSLQSVLDQVSQISQYLWEKGWAERNGGNISYNLTSLSDELNALSPKFGSVPIGLSVPHLKGCYFYVTGTGKRMRYVASDPLENGAIIRIRDNCDHYEIVSDLCVAPTSELPTHLAIHNKLQERGSRYKAMVHTHPTELVAMSHNKAFMKKDVLSKLLWSMIPETRAFCPKGLGVVPYILPGSVDLAKATIEQLDEYDVVMWEKHGVLAVGDDLIEAFDMIDTLSKSAQIYMCARSMGFIPDGMSEDQMNELKEAFNL